MKVTTDGCLFGSWCSNELSTSPYDVQSVLDIGCGTGLLSLMIAQKNNVNIDAVEIDVEAAAQANENVADSPWKEQIKIINKDVLTWSPEKKYDAIISNPPFYENELKSGRHNKDLAHHSEGLRLEELLQFIKQNLSAEGKFFLMLPYKRSNDLEKLLNTVGLTINTKVVVKQTTTHQPFRILVKGSAKNNKTLIEQEIAIKDEHQQYTPAFVSLLKDYYLYL